MQIFSTIGSSGQKVLDYVSPKNHFTRSYGGTVNSHIIHSPYGRKFRNMGFTTGIRMLPDWRPQELS